jgi:2-polyprenyl-6-methoxyphenol hydroxylase-like FAD-dependent oxidoreductase
MQDTSRPIVLISGAGVAGPALAFWLERCGIEPVLIETAPTLRTDGYMIDFWGVGYDVAEIMGLLPQLKRLSYDMSEVRFVDDAGRTAGGFSADLLRSAVGGRYFSIPRSDLAGEIYRSLEGRVETIFGDSITSIEQDDAAVRVTFHHAAPRQVDLVIGADGLHSRVRQLVFGPEADFEKYLGYYVASFTVEGYPHRDEGDFVSYGVPGRQIARYALRGNRTAFFFNWAEDRKLPFDHRDVVAQKELLAQRFGGAGWETDAILAMLPSCSDLYFDSVSQIRMDRWSTGRVALLGDAAFCPSLLAGQGTAFAMIAAYVLAGELDRAHGDFARAFKNYDTTLRTFIESKQQSAPRFGSWLVPRTKGGLFLRNQVTRLMSLPFVGDWMMRSAFSDNFTLPDYRIGRAAPNASAGQGAAS